MFGHTYKCEYEIFLNFRTFNTQVKEGSTYPLLKSATDLSTTVEQQGRAKTLPEKMREGAITLMREDLDTTVDQSGISITVGSVSD